MMRAAIMAPSHLASKAAFCTGSSSRFSREAMSHKTSAHTVGLMNMAGQAVQAYSFFSSAYAGQKIPGYSVAVKKRGPEL